MRSQQFLCCHILLYQGRRGSHHNWCLLFHDTRTWGTQTPIGTGVVFQIQKPGPKSQAKWPDMINMKHFYNKISNSSVEYIKWQKLVVMCYPLNNDFKVEHNGFWQCVFLPKILTLRLWQHTMTLGKQHIPSGILTIPFIITPAASYEAGFYMFHLGRYHEITICVTTNIYLHNYLHSSQLVSCCRDC